MCIFIKWNSVKETLSTNIFLRENLRSGRFILDLYYKQHWGVILEITDIKYKTFSKHLFQRTQQHGDCTKPLGSAKFVWKIMPSSYYIE